MPCGGDPGRPKGATLEGPDKKMLGERASVIFCTYVLVISGPFWDQHGSTLAVWQRVWTTVLADSPRHLAYGKDVMSVQVQVSGVAGHLCRLSLEGSKGARVAEIKKELSEVLKVPVEQQRLLHGCLAAKLYRRTDPCRNLCCKVLI